MGYDAAVALFRQTTLIGRWGFECRAEASRQGHRPHFEPLYRFFANRQPIHIYVGRSYDVP